MQSDFGWIEPSAVDEALRNIETTTSLSDSVAEVFFVIEAVPEVLALKKEVFDNLGKISPPDAVLKQHLHVRRHVRDARGHRRPRPHNSFLQPGPAGAAGGSREGRTHL